MKWFQGDTFHQITWPMVDATDYATRESGIDASDIVVELYGVLRGSSAAMSLISSDTGSLTKDIYQIAHGTFGLALTPADVSGTGASFYDQYILFASCAGCALQELTIDGERIDPSNIYSAVTANFELASDIDSQLTETHSLVSETHSQTLLNASLISDVASQLLLTHDLLSDVESQVDLLATSDYLSNLHSILTSTMSDILSSTRQTNSQVSLVKFLVSDIDSQLTENYSLTSDVDSHVNLLATSNYLSQVHSDLKSALGEISVTLGASALSDIVSGVVAALDFSSDLSDIYSLLENTYSGVVAVDSQLLLTASLVSDIDSQLTLTHSLLSDIESQVDLLATSDYLSAVHSDLKSAIGAVSVTIGASDISDIISGIVDALDFASDLSDIYSRCLDIDSQVTANFELVSDVDSQLTENLSSISEVNSTLVLMQSVLSNTYSMTVDLSNIVSSIKGNQVIIITNQAIALSLISDVDSQLLLNASMISDVQSRLLLVASVVSDIDSQLTENYSLISDVDSQLNLTATSDYLSQLHSDLKSAITNIAISPSDLSDIYSLLQEIDSNVSDIESQVDLLATSNYLSQVHSDIKSGLGAISVELTASDISDIIEAISGAPVQVAGLTSAAIQQLAGITIRLTSPHRGRGDILEIVNGDSYDASYGHGIVFTITGLSFTASDLATAYLRLKRQNDFVSFEATTIVDAGDDIVVTFEPTPEETGALQIGDDWRYNVTLETDGTDPVYITPIYNSVAKVYDDNAD